MERLVCTAECTGVYVVVQVSGLHVQIQLQWNLSYPGPTYPDS